MLTLFIRYPFLKILLIILLTFFVLSLTIKALHKKAYGLSYQVSSSMPKGWYLSRPIDHLQRGDWVFLSPPSFARVYLLKHHWLPDSGILLKSIQALPGDWVCQQHARLMINEHVAAILVERDIDQHKIEKRTFCQYLTEDEYLVLGISDRRSYDSRYFGPVHRSQILAKAIPLLTRN